MREPLIEVVLDAAPGELTWQSYVDQVRLRLSPRAARRLARHLLLQADGAAEKGAASG